MIGNNRQGFPLSVVFLLIAVIAVMIALLNSSLQRNTIGEKPTGFAGWQDGPPPDVDSFFLLLACVAGASTGAMVGGYVGWQSPRRVVGALLGLPIGIILGGMIATILVCPPDFTIMLSGCAIVILTAATMRFFTK